MCSQNMRILLKKCYSMMLGGSAVVDLLGIAIGHIYYYLEDVAPQLPSMRGRRYALYMFMFSLQVDM